MTFEYHHILIVATNIALWLYFVGFTEEIVYEEMIKMSQTITSCPKLPHFTPKRTPLNINLNTYIIELLPLLVSLSFHTPPNFISTSWGCRGGHYLEALPYHVTRNWLQFSCVWHHNCWFALNTRTPFSMNYKISVTLNIIVVKAP